MMAPIAFLALSLAVLPQARAGSEPFLQRSRPPALDSPDVPARRAEESYTVAFKWYPNTPYTSEHVSDYDDQQWWRCGTAGVPTKDTDGETMFCGAVASVADFNPKPDNTGGDCQTIGPLGARSHDEDAVFFWASDSSGTAVETITYGGHAYAPVLVLFESDYCTGPAHEFFAQEKTYAPLDRDGKTPGLMQFKSVRIYFKPQDVELPTQKGLGVKTVVFPFTDMVPYDETSCVKGADDTSGGKFLYKEFKADGWDEKLDCVSADDRVSCVEPGVSQPYAAVAGSDGVGYGCMDFAGCWICNVEGDFTEQTCEASTCNEGKFERADYCDNSPVWALDRSVAGGYPLGSFYYHLYFTTHDDKAYCADSIAEDASNLSPEVCVKGTELHAKYEGMCVATRFHDCSGRVDEEHCGGNACPDANALPYHWASSTIEDLCGDALNTGACYKPIDQHDDPANPTHCGLMKYKDEDGNDADSDEWPLKTTCWTTRIVPCDNVNGQW